ncbi:hypothetical protein HZA56_19435, partial [Candidatus Poribacteria bacterium]|nr:hypothetical protein [Candidatus Poribacteria bacterium]
MWSEVQQVTTQRDGSFRVILGTVNPIMIDPAFYGDLFLGIMLSGRPEMLPRTKLTTVPYAEMSRKAEEAIKAKEADKAIQADKATQADKAIQADKATQADKAVQADKATEADKAAQADDVLDKQINPKSVTISKDDGTKKEVIDKEGKWVGDATGLQG